MLCQECQKSEATIHIIKSVDGKKTELFLCEQCARAKEELEFSYEPQFSMAELFGGILNQQLLGSRGAAASKLQCPSCGLSFAQFSQIGRLGCSDCFNTFQERLNPLLRRIHAGTAHSGKVPVRFRKKVQYRRELEELKAELQRKVQSEEFEEAATLRDRIRDLEQEISTALDDSEKNKGEQ